MLRELKTDLARYPGTGAAQLFAALRCAAIYPIAVYRLGRDLYTRWPRPLALAALIPFKVLAVLTEWASGIYLSPGADIGPGLFIGHWGCIRVASGVRIGAHCNLSPMVILGFGGRDGRTGVPTLGDRVYVASGAKIIGPVRIGSDVAVGANAVVCKDVPAHVSVGGVPAKIISRKGSAAYLQPGQRRTASADERPVEAPGPLRRPA